MNDAKARRRAAEEQRARLQSEIDRLLAARAEEPRKRGQLETLRAAIPDDPNLAQLILDANDAANRAGIDFISITPAVPTAASGPAAPATTTTTAGAGPAEAGQGQPQPAQGPPAAAAGARPVEIKLSLQIKGGYFQVLDFMNRLEDLPRLVVTDAVTITADQPARLTVALTARMFTRTVPPAYAAGATAPAPGGTAAPTPATAPAGRP